MDSMIPFFSVKEAGIVSVSYPITFLSNNPLLVVNELWHQHQSNGGSHTGFFFSLICPAFGI
jgi:hypothetical protein